jgi:peptidoglycan/LPS O-acetylase OafA/YrhL
MQPVKKWSQELEGLRGLASLWVVLGHICILTSFHFPILSDPAIGVDLFILLSGYLMAKNYVERKDKEPWTDSATFKKVLAPPLLSYRPALLRAFDCSHWVW